MPMARRFLPLVLIVFLLQRVALGQQAINWEGTIDSAKTTARQSNRLVLVFFSANWCQACHRLENDLRNQPGAVTALQANFVLVKVNYDYFPNTAKQYGVTRLPTTVILAPGASGDVLAVIPEAMPVDLYLAKLNTIVADAKRRNAGAYAQIQVNPAVGSPSANPQQPGAAAMPGVNGSLPVAAPSNRPVVEAPAMGPVSGPATGHAETGIPLDSQKPSVGPNPPLGLDGYCPVQLIESGRWHKGDKAWGMVHRGRVYLFSGVEERRRFQADPDRYAPVNSGNDVVLALDLGRSVTGFREHGAQYDGHIYLFASEGTLEKFRANPRYYADRALQAIHPAAQGTAMR